MHGFRGWWPNMQVTGDAIEAYRLRVPIQRADHHLRAGGHASEKWWRLHGPHCRFDGDPRGPVGVGR